MNPLNLQISYIDGTQVDVSAVAADLVAFEEHFDKSVAILATDARLTYMFYLAWSVLARTGQTELEFKKWCELVAIVTEGDSKK